MLQGDAHAVPDILDGFGKDTIIHCDQEVVTDLLWQTLDDWLQARFFLQQPLVERRRDIDSGGSLRFTELIENRARRPDSFSVRSTSIALAALAAPPRHQDDVPLVDRIGTLA